MKKRKALYLGIMALLVLPSLVYTVVWYRHEATTARNRAQMMKLLESAKGALASYWRSHNRPPTSPKDLGFDQREREDPVTGKLFVHVPPPPKGKYGAFPVIAQPEAFRSSLWPFGSLHRYALFSDGQVRDMLE